MTTVSQTKPIKYPGMPRPLSPHGRVIVSEILDGLRSPKDLKIAFDWEDTVEGHLYWSGASRSPGLLPEARSKLEYMMRLT